MNGLAVGIGLAVVVLAQVALGWALAVQSRRQQGLADQQQGRNASLAARLAQAEEAARAAAGELAALRDQAALDRAAREDDRERLARVEAAAHVEGERLGRLGVLIEAERAQSARLAFRLAGVSARLALGLADAEVKARAAAAVAEAVGALQREVGASLAGHALTEERVAEAESRLREHADWLARSHEPWLQTHDVRVSALEGRAAAVEAVHVAHERWLSDSHEPWLLRHDRGLAELGENLGALRAGLGAGDQALARYDDRLAALEHEFETIYAPTLQVHGNAIVSHDERLGSIEHRAAALAVDVAAHYRWLDGSHEPWLQRHDIALAESRAALEDLLARMEREEVVIGACAQWLAESHEPWLARHDVQLALLSADLGSRPTSEDVEALSRAVAGTREAQQDGHSREGAAREATAAGQSDILQQLEALRAELESARTTLSGTVKWLGSSHEPWLRRHEAEIKRLLIELPTFTGALEREVAALGQAQLDGLALLEPMIAPAASPRLDLARGAIQESKARRRDARRRGMLPRGVPGPCEGVRLGHGRRPILVVAYSGMQDVFGWLPRLESLDVQVVHLVDTTETWYVDGCDGARSIDEMMEMTREAIAGFDYERLVVIGQSMGGYAALRFGPELGADLIGVFGPQTHHLTQSSMTRGTFLQTPSAVIDVRPALVDSRTPVHVMVSRSEDDNEYVWDDHAHLAGLQDQPSIHIHVCASDDHGVSGYLSRSGKLSGVLTAFFDLAEGRAPTLDLDAL